MRLFTTKWKGKTVVISKQIEMHFAEILHLSEQMERLSEALKKTAQDELMQIVCKNKACWNSSCADLLLRKEAQIGTGLISQAEQLCQIAGKMRRQAKRMYQAELENHQLAATRTYLQQSWK